MELKRRTVLIPEGADRVEYLYEICMEKMPKAPKKYFYDVIVKGKDGWVWTGSGTAVRTNQNGVKEFCQVM